VYTELEYTGAEVGEVVHTIVQIFPDIDPILMMTACLCLAVSIVKPDIEGDAMNQAVKEISEWMMLYADSLEGKNGVVN